MLSGKYIHAIEGDLCDGEDVVIAVLIADQNCDQAHFRNKMNMMKINRLDLKAVSDAIQVLDSTRDTLFRRKIKLEEETQGKLIHAQNELRNIVNKINKYAYERIPGREE